MTFSDTNVDPNLIRKKQIIQMSRPETRDSRRWGRHFVNPPPNTNLQHSPTFLEVPPRVQHFVHVLNIRNSDITCTGVTQLRNESEMVKVKNVFCNCRL